VRTHHFRIGDGQCHDMKSVMKDNFDYKGNAAEIRGHMNEAQKSDLKSHHFKMGSHINDFTTSQKGSVDI